jgi:uncharacterized protein (TIGR02099 family)
MLRFVKWLRIIAAMLVIAFAVLINVARFTLPLLNSHSDFFEKWASRALHEPVHIGQITAGWHGFEPSFNFRHVVITDPEKQHALLQISQLSIGIDLLQSLIHGRLLPGHLLLSGTSFDVIETADGQLQLQGMFNLKAGYQEKTDLGQMKNVLLWMLTQSNVSLKHININYHTAQGELISIANLGLRVENGVIRHQIAGAANLTQAVPTSFRFVLNLKDVDVDKFPYSADLYVEANQIVLKQWLADRYIRKYFQHLQITQGQTDLQLWAKWHSGQLQSVQSVVNAQNIDIKFAAPMQTILLNNLHANLYWQHFADGWGLSADQLQWQMNGKSWPEHTLGIRWIQKNPTATPTILVKTDYVRLADIYAFAMDIGYLPKTLQQTYQQLQLQGELNNFALVYSPATQNEPIYYHLNTQFKGLSVQHWQQIPGITNLTGVVDVTPTETNLKLMSTNTSITLPDWFDQSLAFNKLNLVAQWQHNNTGWQLKIPMLALANNNIDWRGNLALTKPLAGSAVINTALQFDMKNVGLLPMYLPKQGCKPGLCAWLRSAFLQGDLNDGRMVLQGALNQFPFNENQGRFDFSAKLNHIDLRYSLHWPILQDVQGTMIAHDNHMQILVDHTQTVGNPLDHVQADITDLATKPLLTVVGHSKTDLVDGMKFLHQSPLAVAKQMSSMEAAGPMDFNLKLIIPLDNKKNDVVSDGQIVVHQGQLRLPNWNLALSQVDGIFNFHNHDLNAKQVNANLYGMPLTADVATLPVTKDHSMLQLSLDGLMNVASLQQQFNSPLLKYFQGETHYHALLQLHNDDTAVANQLSIVSDLTGLQSTLPEPYNKSAEQLRALAITMNLYNQQPSQIEVHYGNDFSAAVSVDKKNASWQLHGGEIHFGMGSAHFQSRPGLLVTAKLTHVDGADWKDHLFSYLKKSDATSNNNWLHKLNIRAIELSIDQLNWNQYNLINTYLSVTPMNDGWALTVQNAMVLGHLFIPHDHQQAWRGNFARLYLLSGKHNDSTAAIDPRHLPSLNLSIDDFHYNKMMLGKVTVKTSSIPAGMQINAFNVMSPLVNIQAVGTWQMINNKAQTALQGKLTSTDLGTVLKNWQITQVLVDGKGGANFSLAWPGSPQQFTAANLNGDIKFDFRGGRVTHLSQNAESEIGFGRLLNLFSLQSIPLLPLNLVHITQKGFAFSLFKGDFHLNKGSGTTNNTALVGPVAWVQIKGRIGFVNKNYDLNLEVTPNVTSSLPLIVGLAGGPLAGAIAWVADKLLAHQVGKAAQVNYRITGSWDKPSIVKLPAPAETESKQN